MIDRPLTHREIAISRILARCCRGLTNRQLADSLYGGSLSALSRCLKRLVPADWLQSVRVTVEPPPRRPQRLISWQPGAPRPRFGPIAYRLRTLPPRTLRTMTIITSTRRSRDVWAGRCRVKRLDQLGHDLALGAVYLQYYGSYPQMAQRWEAEDQFSAERLPHQKQPDARIRQGGQSVLLIEWASRSYDAPRLESLHDQADREGQSYEVWGEVGP